MRKILFKPAYKIFIYILICAFLLSACSSPQGADKATEVKAVSEVNSGKLEKAPFYDEVEGLPNIEAPEGFDWKSYSGTTSIFW